MQNSFDYIELKFVSTFENTGCVFTRSDELKKIEIGYARGVGLVLHNLIYVAQLCVVFRVGQVSECEK
jgi:hypothetical protein